MRLLGRVVALLAVPAVAAAEPRFFVAGDGALAIASVFTKRPVSVRYRRADGTYDPEALATLAGVLRSKDGRRGPVTPRFAELLGWMYRESGRPLRVVSGYRSPTYNDTIRKKGAKAASGSLHTEGLAADLAFPKTVLVPLWRALRGLDCCGAGYYAASGFLHVDVGRPRFWEAATSRVDENLSAGNARIFARTEFDRYEAGEAVAVTLHAVTLPPLRIARRARLVADDGTEQSLALAGTGDCVDVDGTGATLHFGGAGPVARGRVVLGTCEPRLEATPATVESNPIAVR